MQIKKLDIVRVLSGIALTIGISPVFAVPFDGLTAGTAGISALQILNDGHSVGDGIYWIDPDGAGGNAPFQAYADMTRQGGGWTFGLKTWYQAGHFQNAGAVGSVSDALTIKGNAYKLADDSIRSIIGTSGNFDVMADQAGYNNAYSTGNYEYAILLNYTGIWSWDQAMADSTTTTTLQSYRNSDGSLAWSGELIYGMGGAGINGYTLASGSSNPAGGSGCDIDMGLADNSGWHHFYMGETNSDSYLYLCNGPQHSSSFDMNHRYWFRERVSHDTQGFSGDVPEPATVVLMGLGLAVFGFTRRNPKLAA